MPLGALVSSIPYLSHRYAMGSSYEPQAAQQHREGLLGALKLLLGAKPPGGGRCCGTRGSSRCAVLTEVHLGSPPPCAATACLCWRMCHGRPEVHHGEPSHAATVVRVSAYAPRVALSVHQRAAPSRIGLLHSGRASQA